MNELKKALMSVSGPELLAVGRQIVGDNSYSDEELTGKFAPLRRQYPAYDAICHEMQRQTMLEETLIHTSGMELMLRILITIAEERDRTQQGGGYSPPAARSSKPTP